jgi:hypothetical protein
MKKLNVTGKLLYDGEEMEMPSSFRISVALREIELTLSDIYGNSFENLAAIISDQDFKRIAETLTIDYFDGITLYLVDGVQVYYAVKDEYFVIFTFGEIQPGRYKLYLESVWVKD